MENEKSINEFDFNLICEYFSSIDRQGPGSEEMTKLALRHVEGLTKSSKIADLGCGTGGQADKLSRWRKTLRRRLSLWICFRHLSTNSSCGLKR